jgi:formylmethanofuran dehydrogenase subunit D
MTLFQHQLNLSPGDIVKVKHQPGRWVVVDVVAAGVQVRPINPPLPMLVDPRNIRRAR